MRGHISVVYRFIHADIEGLAFCLRIVDGQRNGGDQIIDMHKVALERFAMGIKQHRYGFIFAITGGIFCWNQVFPNRPAEHIVTK